MMSRSTLAALLFVLFSLFAGQDASAAAGWTSAPSSEGYADTLEPAPLPPDGWATTPGIFVDVHTPAHQDRLARRLRAHADEAVPRLAKELGVAPGRTMHIFVAPDDATFAGIQPGSTPSWADGTAWPHRGLIYLHAPEARDGTATPLEQVLDHEIVHVLLGRAFGQRPVPSWLQEGMAKLLAREYSSEMNASLATGMLGGSLLSLDDLTGRFPSDPVRAQLAYAQSADFVAFIRNEWGTEATATLVREMSRGASVEAALRAATGQSTDALEKAWRGRLSSSMPWLRPLVSDTALFGVGAVVLVVGGVFNLRRRREKLDRMAREDAIHDALALALERNLVAEVAPPVHLGWAANPVAPHVVH